MLLQAIEINPMGHSYIVYIEHTLSHHLSQNTYALLWLS